MDYLKRAEKILNKTMNVKAMPVPKEREAWMSISTRLPWMPSYTEEAKEKFLIKLKEQRENQEKERASFFEKHPTVDVQMDKILTLVRCLEIDHSEKTPLEEIKRIAAQTKQDYLEYYQYDSNL